MPTLRFRLVNQTLLVVALSAALALLEGPAFWAGAAVVVGAALVGAQVLLAGESMRPAAATWRERLVADSLPLPAVAAFASGGLVHLAGVGWLTLPALVLGGGIFAASLMLELRLMGPADALRARTERQLQPFLVLVGFAAFAGVAGAVPGGLADQVPASGSGIAPGIDQLGLLQLALADAVVAFLLGYRLSALRTLRPLDSAIAGGTYAVVLGIAAALVRVAALPRLVGPALLAGVLYLWSAYRLASSEERRSARWLWEYLVLAVALALVIAWSLLGRA